MHRAPWLSTLAASILALLVAAATATAGSAAGGADDGVQGGMDGIPIAGRYSVPSEAGGAVWAFLSDGRLIVMGPGDLMATGTWSPGSAEGEFDAGLDVAITGQALRILGSMSSDEDRLAIYAEASEPRSPEDGAAWPSVSRLVGERIGLVPEPAESPGTAPGDCLRPAWRDGDEIDWDRCAVTDVSSPGTVSPGASPVVQGSPAPSLPA
jgi:hypothetical protein